MKKIQFILLLVAGLASRLKKRLFSWKIQRPRLKEMFSLRNLLVFWGMILISSLIFFRQFFYPQPSFSQGIIGLYRQDLLPEIVLALLSEPLVTVDESGQPKPNLVSGWQVNNNATVYTFKLKNDLFWNDGSLVNSSDLVFNLPEVDVSYPDNLTIQFKLNEPYVPFPMLLTMPILKKNSLVGLGKYQVVKEDLNKDLVSTLVLRPKKTDETQVLPKVVIKFYPDDKTAKAAFELGEVNSLLNISNSFALTNYHTADVKKITNYKKIVGVFYNTKDSLLSDKNLRKALSLAIPKIEDEEKTKTSIPFFSWAFNENVKNLTGDPALAAKYLAKVKSPEKLSLILTTTPSLNKVGQMVVEAWQKIGVGAVLREESGVPQNFQALLISQTIPQDPDQYSLWHSTSTSTNLSQYKSDRVDKDLEDGRRAGDSNKRRQFYLDFQKTLADDSPAAFLYFPKFNILYRKKVEALLNQVLPLEAPYL